MIIMSDVITIENRLRGNIELALSEGSLFFQREGSVWNTLRRLATVLGNNNISYAVSGGLASFHHGYRCFTESIDVVVDPAGFRRIENQLSEFERPFATGRRFIDCATGVSVRFYLAGSKAGEVVAFPPTDLISEIDDGIRFVNLPTLLTLKMATGLENSWPTREMADVQEIVKELCLTDSLANELHPAVRAEHVAVIGGEHHDGVVGHPRRVEGFEDARDRVVDELL